MSGNITKEYIVWCGLCSQWERFEAKTKTQFIREIKKCGWVETKEHGFICSACERKNKDGKNNNGN